VTVRPYRRTAEDSGPYNIEQPDSTLVGTAVPGGPALDLHALGRVWNPPLRKPIPRNHVVVVPYRVPPTRAADSRPYDAAPPP